MRPGPLAPVLALDIDGTSGDHHGHFTWFAELYMGRPMPPVDRFTGGVPFHEHLGVSRQMYNRMKLAYRQGGFKRSMPVYDGIGDFTRYVRSRGVQVWICTTRPYLRMDNMDPDTRHWIRDRAKMQYDNLLYGPHKYRDLVKAVGKDRIVMVVDDLPKMVEQAMRLDLAAVLRTQPYNTYWRCPADRSGKVIRASNVQDYRTLFDLLMDERER